MASWVEFQRAVVMDRARVRCEIFARERLAAMFRAGAPVCGRFRVRFSSEEHQFDLGFFDYNSGKDFLIFSSDPARKRNFAFENIGKVAYEWETSLVMDLVRDLEPIRDEIVVLTDVVNYLHAAEMCLLAHLD
jgi:hypothetical protein